MLIGKINEKIKTLYFTEKGFGRLRFNLFKLIIYSSQILLSHKVNMK
jgi:hypothetical protein